MSRDIGAPEKRSVFLAIVTAAMNLYLPAYGVDALLSTVDSLLGAVAGFNGLNEFRGGFAGLVFLASFPALLILIFVPHLPNWFFLAPVLFLIWTDLGAYPVRGWAPEATMDLVLSMIQLGFFASALAGVKQWTGHWRLTARDLPRKTHLLRHTLIALVLTILCLPFVLSGLAAVAIADAIEKQTGGYLHFGASGIDVRESVLTKGAQTVHLIGMVHIGEDRFYRQVFDDFPPGALVLIEGVTDTHRRIAHKLSYTKAAQAIGLNQQPQFEQVLQEKKAEQDAAAKEQPAASFPDIVDGDVDLSDLSPTTIIFIDFMANVYGSASLSEAVAKLRNPPKDFKKDDVLAVLKDLIETRNAKVLSEFDMRNAGYKTIVIPWGAEHMPGLEAGLKQRGFTLQSQSRIRVADYGTIFNTLFRRH